MKDRSKGFITIAVGDDRYYKMAENLLYSYRSLTADPLPFAILCDKKHSSADLFDLTVLWEDASSSYLEKLMLDRYLPFDETIFIDADCLACSDLNKMFDAFSDADDFSCLGYSAPYGEMENGWFSPDSFPESNGGNRDIITKAVAEERIHYSLKMHGGVYYIKKSPVSDSVFCEARNVIRYYDRYRFRLFEKPADEPAFALAMALNDCLPVHFPSYPLSCYWNTKLIFKRDGTVYRKDGTEVPIVHWGSSNTKTAAYRRQLDLIKAKAGHLKGFAAVKTAAVDNTAVFAERLKKTMKPKTLFSKAISAASGKSWIKSA